MPSLPLVVLAEARSLAWRTGIDEPSATSITAEAWSDHPDPLWRSVAHRRCVDERRRLSGRTGPDRQPVPILDHPDWPDRGVEDPALEAVEVRRDLSAALANLGDAEVGRLARHYWLGEPLHRPCCPLPPRMREALQHASHGKTNEQIARAMGVSINTAKRHMERCYAALHAADRTHAVAIALRAGWIT
jgi:DNA-directed RNA polymerase specialized sigma24 family protein